MCLIKTSFVTYIVTEFWNLHIIKMITLSTFCLINCFSFCIHLVVKWAKTYFDKNKKLKMCGTTRSGGDYALSFSENRSLPLTLAIKVLFFISSCFSSTWLWEQKDASKCTFTKSSVLTVLMYRMIYHTLHNF